MASPSLSPLLNSSARWNSPRSLALNFKRDAVAHSRRSRKYSAASPTSSCLDSCCAKEGPMSFADAPMTPQNTPETRVHQDRPPPQHMQVPSSLGGRKGRILIETGAKGPVSRQIVGIYDGFHLTTSLSTQLETSAFDKYGATDHSLSNPKPHWLRSPEGRQDEVFQGGDCASSFEQVTTSDNWMTQELSPRCPVKPQLRPQQIDMDPPSPIPMLPSPMLGHPPAMYANTEPDLLPTNRELNSPQFPPGTSFISAGASPKRDPIQWLTSLQLDESEIKKDTQKDPDDVCMADADSHVPDPGRSLAVGLGLGLSLSAPIFWSSCDEPPATTVLPVSTPKILRREFGPTKLNEQVNDPIPSDASSARASPGGTNSQHNGQAKLASSTTPKTMTPETNVARELQENVIPIGATSPRSGGVRGHHHTVHGKTARHPSSPRSPALEHAMAVVSPILGRLPASCGGSPGLPKASTLAAREGRAPYGNSTCSAHCSRVPVLRCKLL